MRPWSGRRSRPCPHPGDPGPVLRRARAPPARSPIPVSPIHLCPAGPRRRVNARVRDVLLGRSEEHTSELQSLTNLVCRLLLEKKKQNIEKIKLSKTKIIDKTI